MIEGYCVKCREKRVLTDPRPVTVKNGKPALLGKCGTCGANLYRFGNFENANLP